MRNLSKNYVAVTINSIIKDQDRFYNQKMFWRRNFTLQGVTKYRNVFKLEKQISFLYPKCDFNSKKQILNRSISMFDDLSSDCNCQKFLQFDKYNCQDFISAERFAHFMEGGLTKFFKKPSETSPDIRVENMHNTGVGFKKIYRFSFPFMSSSNNAQGEVRLLLYFLAFYIFCNYACFFSVVYLLFLSLRMFHTSSSSYEK